MKTFNKLLEFICYFFALGMMWVGAEWVFDGGVHTSAVDTAVCVFVARLLMER